MAMRWRTEAWENSPESWVLVLVRPNMGLSPESWVLGAGRFRTSPWQANEGCNFDAARSHWPDSSRAAGRFFEIVVRGIPNAPSASLPNRAGIQARYCLIVASSATISAFRSTGRRHAAREPTSPRVSAATWWGIYFFPALEGSLKEVLNEIDDGVDLGYLKPNRPAADLGDQANVRPSLIKIGISPSPWRGRRDLRSRHPTHKEPGHCVMAYVVGTGGSENSHFPIV
jgi:hypothetical protein